MIGVATRFLSMRLSASGFEPAWYSIVALAPAPNGDQILSTLHQTEEQWVDETLWGFATRTLRIWPSGQGLYIRQEPGTSLNGR